MWTLWKVCCQKPDGGWKCSPIESRCGRLLGYSYTAPPFFHRSAQCWRSGHLYSSAGYIQMLHWLMVFIVHIGYILKAFFLVSSVHWPLLGTVVKHWWLLSFACVIHSSLLAVWLESGCEARKNTMLMRWRRQVVFEWRNSSQILNCFPSNGMLAQDYTLTCP